jgi:S-adenosylmethionine decarboxylase
MMMTQVLVDFYRCDPIMNDPAALAAVAKTAAESVGATIVGEYEMRYTPHGSTVAVFLAESHIVLTTWPEYRLTLVDILLCNPQMDHAAVAATLRRHICPDGEMKVHEVRRRIDFQPEGSA